MPALQFEGTRYFDAVHFFPFLGNRHIFLSSYIFHLNAFQLDEHAEGHAWVSPGSDPSGAAT
jgi:hypothetical protein